MDAKDLRTESAVSERNNDGSKYSQNGGIALHCDRNKSYHDIGSNSLGKVDVPNPRPCAVIGPDRVVPPPAVSEAYHLKKGPPEPWPCMDNAYRRPPEYPHKLTNFQNPTRNISPRQTFQENMQRIMVPPIYNSIKINEDTSYAQSSDRSSGLNKNIKLNMPPEAKFCDVPYAVNPTNEHKNVRNPEMCLPSVNPTLTRTAPHGWPASSGNLRTTRMYGAPEMYQYQDYPSCAGPRPVVPRPHRTVPEDQGYVYADPYYQEGNIRFKPYPSVKERYPQQRYEYIGNYSNPFHPPPGFPSHKYELQKSIPPHPYSPYPPIKYLESRGAEPVLEGYQRNPQANYNIQYRNQVIHPNYGPVIGNCPQNKMHSYPPDAHVKPIPPNKLPYDSNTKAYIEYDNNRSKIYPPSESYFVNEMSRLPVKGQVIMPNYPSINMHNIPPMPYYKKDGQQIKGYDHMAHYRNLDPNLNIHNSLSRHAPVFSPNALAISPTDSNTSNDTTQTLGTSQEDCGYVSQSSTASVRSIDSGINRIPNEYLRKYYDNRYGPMVRTSIMSKSQLNSNNSVSKDKKQIDVRQFLQMWNEGDEEQEDNNSKEITIQTGSTDKNNFNKPHEAMNSQEQLYVLGLVNVPSEELAKYEHIQKVSKLPENIKGYNSIELLKQFEEVIESSNMNNYKTPPTPKEYHNITIKGVHQKQITGVIPPRPVSPLDVEAKISQSVIHKEVGCNFEIKPCSPKMLNVEVAAPVQNLLVERSIEKVANPVMMKSPMLDGINENVDCNIMKRTNHHLSLNENARNPSCKMIKTQYSNSNTIDSIKSSYSLQDLESNSGLCLASLPRLDNDIELNFPEVNQQFINANKGDSTVLTTPIRDLPTLEVLDQSDSQNKEKFDVISPTRPESDMDKSLYGVESEKEFSKLSKYRKTKVNSLESKETHSTHTHILKETQIHRNAIRTDSVIIKNPENIKNYEENSDFSNSLNKVMSDIQQAPINLTSLGSFANNIERESDNIKLNDTGDKQFPVEIAIDFSLNKTNLLDSTESTETKIDSNMDTTMQLEENSLNRLINSETPPNTINLLPVFSEGSAYENSNLDHPKDIDDTANPGTEINHIDINENQQSIDSYNGKSEINVNQSVSNTDDVNVLIANTKSEVYENELLIKINNDNYDKEINYSKVVTTDELSGDSNYTLNELDSEISQVHQNFELKCNNNRDETTANVAKDDDFCDKNNLVDKLESPELEIKQGDKDNLSNIVVTKQEQPLNNIDTHLLLTEEESCCNNSENATLIQSDNLNFESQTVVNDTVIDPINNNIDVDSDQLFKDLTDQDSELKNVENEHCEDIKGSLETVNLSQLNGSVIDNTVNVCEQPVLKNLWYGSKEMYSPWIQKLLTFSEGSCSNTLSDNYIDQDYDILVNSADIVNDVTVNKEKCDDYDCELYDDTRKPVPEISHKNITDDLNQNSCSETLESRMDKHAFNPTVLDSNNDVTVNSNDHFECSNSPRTEEISNKENVVVDDVEEIVGANTPVLSGESIEINPSLDPTLKSDEDTNIDFENQVSDFEVHHETPNTHVEELLSESYQEESEYCEERPGDKNEQSAPIENARFSSNDILTNGFSKKKLQLLKRSLSDSALNMYGNDERPKQENEENVQFIWPFKRRKINNVDNDVLAQNLCNIIQNNRRNSVSSFYNEDNVSFCILIDNSCIITEEENEESEKVCYTELSEDCLTEIQNNCTKDDNDDDNIEPVAEVISSPQQENACDYLDSFALDCEDKTFEESWVEDVGCVETVISDDIAEDIEICGPSSPKNDILSDNDESDVFSCSEHTDKVKFIYGDKMCSDDALFVETLYKTPQMDVNKTLYNRERQGSEEYERYYDNDSLEKMLSEPNEQVMSPYIPQSIDSIFPSCNVSSKETPENKENINIETLQVQNKSNALDNVVDINVDKIEHENTHSIEIFANSRDDAVHSCESSVDNVFAYNQKDEDAIYTSSSPEVSSTTSEEKSSGILLKITNFKGSRISQINDIARVNKRPSCKFTEDKEYLHSHSNYSSNRPLLTKAAQKYIPPLKESIRDLKVKLSLPQHSLMKLKQLKLSKDEPKVNKQNSTLPPIPKKPKPKFEDVLKSIDEIQFKKHKEKTKKTKKTIPKVVIKKTQNGSHYASTSNKNDFNPDLTGRKWQPWVFIEKNHFIDKMVTKKKTKAIYSHRKRTYVLAEKFQKYKSASSAKFVISPPMSDNPSSGLKYTIRLKHNY